MAEEYSDSYIAEMDDIVNRLQADEARRMARDHPRHGWRHRGIGAGRQYASGLLERLHEIEAENPEKYRNWTAAGKAAGIVFTSQVIFDWMFNSLDGGSNWLQDYTPIVEGASQWVLAHKYLHSDNEENPATTLEKSLEWGLKTWGVYDVFTGMYEGINGTIDTAKEIMVDTKDAAMRSTEPLVKPVYDITQLVVDGTKGLVAAAIAGYSTVKKKTLKDMFSYSFGSKDGKEKRSYNIPADATRVGIGLAGALSVYALGDNVLEAMGASEKVADVTSTLGAGTAGYLQSNLIENTFVRRVMKSAYAGLAATWVQDVKLAADTLGEKSVLWLTSLGLNEALSKFTFFNSKPYKTS